MLLGEQFGRRHHRRLMPTFDRTKHRPERNDRLAAADVAHEHPVHLIRPRKVGADFIDRARLRSGERKRQLIYHLRAKALRAVERDSHPARAPQALNRKCKLERKQFIERERQMPARLALCQRIEVGIIRWIVKIAKRSTDRRHFAAYFIGDCASDRIAQLNDGA